MVTVLKQIENVINNRPISYTYFESDLIEPITSNKLLYGRNLEVINIVNDTSPMVDLTVTKREQNLQALLKHFGFRWTTEYLSELRQHQRRSNKNKRITWLNRPVNKLFPFEVADEKKKEVPTFIEQECGPGTKCLGGVT